MRTRGTAGDIDDIGEIDEQSIGRLLLRPFEVTTIFAAYKGEKELKISDFIGPEQ